MAGQDQVAIEPVAAGDEGGEAHADVEGDAGLFGEDGDGADGSDHGEYAIEGGADEGIGAGEQGVEGA